MAWAAAWPSFTRCASTRVSAVPHFNSRCGSVKAAPKHHASALSTPPRLHLQDEIFGPLLPVLSVATVDEAISFVNKREKPLALYVFTESAKNRKKVLASTSAGGTTINDCLLHAVNPSLPFGGIGNSGA